MDGRWEGWRDGWWEVGEWVDHEKKVARWGTFFFFFLSLGSGLGFRGRSMSFYHLSNLAWNHSACDCLACLELFSLEIHLGINVTVRHQFIVSHRG